MDKFTEEQQLTLIDEGYTTVLEQYASKSLDSYRHSTITIEDDKFKYTNNFPVNVDVDDGSYDYCTTTSLYDKFEGIFDYRIEPIKSTREVR